MQFEWVAHLAATVVPPHGSWGGGCDCDNRLYMILSVGHILPCMDLGVVIWLRKMIPREVASMICLVLVLVVFLCAFLMGSSV